MSYIVVLNLRGAIIRVMGVLENVIMRVNYNSAYIVVIFQDVVNVEAC